VVGSYVKGEELIGLYISLRENLLDMRVSFCNQVFLGESAHWYVTGFL